MVASTLCSNCSQLFILAASRLREPKFCDRLFIYFFCLFSCKTHFFEFDKQNNETNSPPFNLHFSNLTTRGIESATWNAMQELLNLGYCVSLFYFIKARLNYTRYTNKKKQKNTDTFLQRREKQIKNKKERTQCKNLKLNNNKHNDNDEGHNGGKTTFSC